MQKPSTGYIFLLPIPLKIAIEVIFEGIATKPFWAALPWNYIMVFSIGATLPLLLNDALNSRSWLRKILYDLRVPFHPLKLIVSENVNPDRVVLLTNVHFRRKQNKVAIRVFGMELFGPKEKPKVLLFQSNLTDVVPGKIERVVLGSIMLKSPSWTPRHSVWGEDIGPQNLPHGSKPIIQSGKYLIEIEINNWSECFLVKRVDLKNSSGEGFQLFDSSDAELLLKN